MTTPLQNLLADVKAGHRLTEKEAHLLFSVRDRQVWDVARAANEVREDRAGPAITYVLNQNINVTNLCVNACGFCGFSKKPGDVGIYFHDKTEIQKKAALAKERGVSEICTVSGLHPAFTAQSYADVYRWIHEAAPGVHLHASNPMEVAYAAKKSGMSTKDVLVLMKEAGLGSMCGTAAEILVDSVRETICREKIATSEWVRIIKEAHRLGIPTTATIMYGHCETDNDRVKHLSILRDIQDETSGFTEFVPLSFIHMNTPLFRAGKARAGATGREDLLMVAVLGTPRPWASVMIRIHSFVGIFSLQIFRRTSSTRISAAVPHIELSPASFIASITSTVLILLFFAAYATSIGLLAWRWMPGAASWIQRYTSV